VEGGALRAGRPAFVAAALAERDAAPALASILERVRGVRRVIAASGLADPDGDAPRRAVVAAALLDAPRSAIDLGAELARSDAAGAVLPGLLPGLGVAASLHAPDASMTTLISVALEGARVVRAAPGGRPGIAHSELYELEARRRSRAFLADAADERAHGVLRPTPAPPTAAPGEGHLRALEVRAHAALVEQLEAEARGLRAERARADRAERREEIERRLLVVSDRLGDAEAEGRRLGRLDHEPA